MIKKLITFLFKHPTLPVGFTVALFFLLTILWRVNTYSPSYDVVNIDASYHVLLTMKSLDQGSARDHLFLPLVTLSENNAEKHISWGSTISDSKGNYYYTSFPQLGFVAPLLVLKSFHAEMTVINLMFVNFFIEAVTIVLLMVLTYRIFRDIKAKDTIMATCFAGLIALVYIFSLEVFYSQGIIYWAQSLMQPILIGQLLTVYMIAASTRFKTHLAIVLGILIFAGTLTEWTGYISAAGIVAYFVYRAIKSKKSSYVVYAAIATVSIVLGVVAYLVPFVINTSFSDYLAVSAQRFTARSTSASVGPTFEQFTTSYFESFGPFIVAVFVGIAMLYTDKLSWNAFRTTVHRRFFILLLATVPLIENVIMRQHAYQYSFDRLKVFIPLAILSVIIFTSAQSKRMQTVLVCVLLVCVPVGIVQIRQSSRTVSYTDFSKTTAVISSLRREYPNASYSFSGTVRGWLNLQVGTNIHEGVTDYQEFKKDCTRKTCIWLVGTQHGTAQYSIYGAYVVDTEHHSTSTVGEPQCEYCKNTPAILR